MAFKYRGRRSFFRTRREHCGQVLDSSIHFSMQYKPNTWPQGKDTTRWDPSIVRASAHIIHLATWSSESLPLPFRPQVEESRSTYDRRDRGILLLARFEMKKIFGQNELPTLKLYSLDVDWLILNIKIMHQSKSPKLFSGC